ncbi:MAG TPA: bifunctional polysaccharide deacetylase/glycosyltransferase family 2 protein [Microlunatus sp.]|nr:bifunctional polysaccharide deacetylase/glycosyltransferase family 2 protein [Microlunatus sp.]
MASPHRQRRTALDAQRQEPRAHWLLLTVILLSTIGCLVVAGLVHGQLGESADAPSSRPVAGTAPQMVLEGGPIVDPGRSDEPGLRVPNRHVVLTFDDGPTQWTSDILDVLAARHVPATFFVIGARAAERPDLVRRMYAEGHEVGLHTFTHLNAANASPARLRVELDQTQLVLAGATGHLTDLVRLPYSSQPDAVTASDWHAMRGMVGYRVVFTDLDTKDWQRPGVDQIVAAGLPTGNPGAVIMLHDGGGDRSQTVAALDRLITQLRQRGYTFDTVSSAIGAGSAWRPASTIQRVEGRLLSGVVIVSDLFVRALRVLLAVLAVVAVLRMALVVVLARRHHAQPRPLDPGSGPRPPVSVIVPAYNEELGIAATVRSLAITDYPTVEVIVVDDGSTDATADVVTALGLPNVRLLRQPNAGKPAALNTGLHAASHEIVVMVDGDTVFEPDAITELVRPISRAEVGAVSGNTKVGNRSGLLGRWQHIEYVIGFNLDRRMFDELGCVPTVPGAIGAFRRRAIADAGGISTETLAEDTDLTIAIGRAGWRVVYAPDARAWTEVPATLSQLWRQRYRWCFGTLQAMWKHRGSFAQQGAGGRLGRRALPYLLAFQVVLPLLAPIIDVAAIYALIVEPSAIIVSVWLIFLLLQVLSGAYAFRLDNERLGPLWSLPLQQLVYRQLMYLVVIQSAASAVYGTRLRWQPMRRTGEMTLPMAMPRPR